MKLLGAHALKGPQDSNGSVAQDPPSAARAPKAPGPATVIFVESDRNVLYRMSKALNTQGKAKLVASVREAEDVPLPSGTVGLLILGPSQTGEATLEEVGSMLTGRPGLGAVLVVHEPSADVLRWALHAGIDDAIETSNIESQLPQAVIELIGRLEDELEAAEEAARLAQAAGPRKGWVTTVFSPKGGVGKSVVSINLAASLAKHTGKPSVIFDLDLQFGDAAVMLRLQPTHTVTDAISAGDLLDESLLKTFLVRHEKSNVWVLPAPTAPSEADQVDPAGMLRVLNLLQDMFENVIIDSPPHLSDVVLQAVAESDTVVFIVALDVPSVKNAHLGLQAFDLLQFPTEKVMLVINRADSKVHLAVGDIERALEKKVDLTLPSEAVVPRSVNQGVPAFLEYPKSRFVAQIEELSDMVHGRATKVPPKVMVQR